MGWRTEHNAANNCTDPAVNDSERLEDVRRMGVDEKRFLNANVTHRRKFTTQIVDLDRHRLLDVIEG